MNEGEKSQKKDGFRVKTFPVPFALGEIKENISISTNTPSKLSKEQIIYQALKFHADGNIQEAAKYYQDLINQGFNDYRVFSNYGVILKGLGKFQEAEISLRKSIKLKPDFAEASNCLGGLLINLGKYKEAEKFIRKSIKLKPNTIGAYYNLGTTLYNLGLIKEAEIYTRKEIKINPDFALAYLNLGSILIALGNLKEAELSTRKAIELNPDFVEAHSNLGTIFKDLGKLKEAENSQRKAIAINSNFADAHSNLGNILKDLGKLEEAELSSRKAIEINPNLGVAHYNLGGILKDLGKLQEAEFSYRKAIEINPNFADAYCNLGVIFNDLDRVEEAKLLFENAIRLNPSSADINYNLGMVLRKQGKLKESLSLFQNLLSNHPNNDKIKAELVFIASKLSELNIVDKYASDISTLGVEKGVCDPMKLLHLEDNPQAHLTRAINFYNKEIKGVCKRIDYYKKEMIYIGYFSADFNLHPVMHLISRIIELHDSSKFKIFLYSFGLEDNYTKSIKEKVFCFRNIRNYSDLKATEIARNDNLDIAIDLMGYTKKNRMKIFSYRIAPVQINFLGFPSTTGSKEIDYLIGDKTIIPEENKKYFTEKILYMPTCYMPFNDQIKFSNKSFKRSDFNLPIDKIVLAAFHKNQKITSKEINSWSRILNMLTNSVLWISDIAKTPKINLLKYFTNNGINSERIIFAKRMNTIEEHLSRHSCADIFLDTFNYNAHSTAIDSLWAELPIVTLMGRSFSSRVGGSLLNAIGLEELITETTKQYEEVVIDLGNNPEKLKMIKRKIKSEKMSNPLFDSSEFTKNLEKIYLNLIKIEEKKK